MFLILKDLWIIVGLIYWLNIYLLDNHNFDNKNEFTNIDRALQIIFFPITGIVCALNYILYGNLNLLR